MSGVEILGIAAGVVQIAELGGKLSVKLFTFTRKIKNADRNIDSISQDIAATGAVLQQLGNELKKDEKLRLCSPEAISTAKSLMEQCHQIFKELNDAVDGKGKGLGSGAKVILGLRQRINYPFLEPQIELLKANLEKLKSSLLVMLNVLIFAEQLKNQEALPILKDQRELLKSLVDERNASHKQYDLVLKRLDQLAVGRDDSSLSSLSTETTRTTNSNMTLVSSTASLPKSAPHFDKDSLLPKLPAHLHHRAKEMFDHCRLVQAVIEEVNHTQYKIDLGIRYRTQEMILDSHYNEWVHQVEAARANAQDQNPQPQYEFLAKAPELKRHWERKRSHRMMMAQPNFMQTWQPGQPAQQQQQQHQYRPLQANGQQDPGRLRQQQQMQQQMQHTAARDSASPHPTPAAPTAPQWSTSSTSSTVQQGHVPPNYVLQDYQMELMLREQQNKKRLMMARQEQQRANNLKQNEAQPLQQGQMAGQLPHGQPMAQQKYHSGQQPISNPNDQDIQWPRAEKSRLQNMTDDELRQAIMEMHRQQPQTQMQQQIAQQRMASREPLPEQQQRIQPQVQRPGQGNGAPLPTPPRITDPFLDTSLVDIPPIPTVSSPLKRSRSRSVSSRLSKRQTRSNLANVDPQQETAKSFSDAGQHFNLDFSTQQGLDVLENFEFDSFLKNADQPKLNFDQAQDAEQLDLDLGEDEVDGTAVAPTIVNSPDDSDIATPVPHSKKMALAREYDGEPIRAKPARGRKGADDVKSEQTEASEYSVPPVLHRLGSERGRERHAARHVWESTPSPAQTPVDQNAATLLPSGADGSPLRPSVGSNEGQQMEELKSKIPPPPPQNDKPLVSATFIPTGDSFGPGVGVPPLDRTSAEVDRVHSSYGPWSDMVEDGYEAGGNLRRAQKKRIEEERQRMVVLKRQREQYLASMRQQQEMQEQAHQPAPTQQAGSQRQQQQQQQQHRQRQQQATRDNGKESIEDLIAKYTLLEEKDIKRVQEEVAVN